MRRLSITFLLIFTFFSLGSLPATSTVKGRIEYDIPVDYSNLSEDDLNFSARNYFFNALRAKDGEVNDDTTSALMLYTILQKMNPDHTEYSVK